MNHGQRRYSDQGNYSSEEDERFYDSFDDEEDDRDVLEHEEYEYDYKTRPSKNNPVPKQRTVFPKDLQDSYDGNSKDFQERVQPYANQNKGRRNEGRRYSDGEHREYDEEKGSFSDVPALSDGDARRQRNQRQRDYDFDNRGYSDGETLRPREKRAHARDEKRRRDADRFVEQQPRERRPPQNDDIDDDYPPVRYQEQTPPKTVFPKRFPPSPKGPGMNDRTINRESASDYDHHHYHRQQRIRNNVRGRVNREPIKDRDMIGHCHHPEGRGYFVNDHIKHRRQSNMEHYPKRGQYKRNVDDWSHWDDINLKENYGLGYDDDHYNFQDFLNKKQEPMYKPLRRDFITQDTLVNILLNQKDFRSTLLHLHEAFHLPLGPLRKLIASNSQIFRQLGEAVQLKININICSSHNGPSGCMNRSTCTDLHICAKYAENKCKNDNCIMGHNWLTSRNIKIINGLQLDNINNEIMEKIMKFSVTSSTSNQIDVCLNYNNKGCQRLNCPKLHVCHSFIKGLSQCSRQNCQLNHDLLTSDCCRLLEVAGIDVNESPRDVLVALLDANPSLKNRAAKTKSTDEQDSATSALNENTLRETRDKKMKPKKIRTVWTYESKGDVDIEEICYDSVESRCSNETTGCQRLHASEHYHWQVSEQGKTWINLQPHQVRSLELSFCDVNNDGCDLPRVDPQQFQGLHSSLITLIGRDVWSADFKTMTIADSKKIRTLKIRRLCTQMVSGKKVDASTFVWYFLDKQNNWVKYGEIDTLGAKDLVSSVTSADIEKQYSRGAPNMSFNNSQFTYILDYKNMTQTNKNTNVAREVRRRPEVHLKNEEEIEMEEDNRRLPPEWEKMKPNERLKHVTIPQTSDEYKKVVQLLTKTITTPNVTQLERIQNRFHWNAFQNKVAELSSIYGDEAKLDIRQLFHGTSHNVVQQICSENFDPRLHGQAAGQAYGQGTYFARDASLSLGYCKADSSSQKYLFVAKVAVGSLTLGNSSMARPPINPATKAPFDSTGDNATNPSIIVKYDKAEYYPEYIITLK